MRKFKRWIGSKLLPIWPNSVVCAEEERCLELARQMLDEESTPADDKYVMKHIDGCYKCYDNFNIEKAIKSALKRKSRNMRIPSEVVNEIKSKIRTH